MAEELFCPPMVDIGHGQPFTTSIPTAARANCMNMWVESGGFPEGLDDADHAGTKALFLESRGAHELSNRLVSATGELTEKLTMVEKVDPEHLGDGKNPHRVGDGFEHFVVEKRCEGGGSFGIT